MAAITSPTDAETLCRVCRPSVGRISCANRTAISHSTPARHMSRNVPSPMATVEDQMAPAQGCGMPRYSCITAVVQPIFVPAMEPSSGRC